ncbi:TIM barrel protein [Aureimonas sp. ME7]|uniref:hydroxypyruvate isomerase family protein n=1 Tax=Aureimonas sp. ME7 TaxID=2744252 RepID=UPI0015F3C3BE|nr:TIM barrel protein [Aureimonas sp. ME7]
MHDPSLTGQATRRYSAHLGYLFTELPLEDRFAAAARAGFAAVEHSNPYSLPAGRVLELCRGHGLEFLQLALPGGDAARGDKGLAGVPGREEEFRDGVEAGLRYARDVGARYVHAMAGVLPSGAGRQDVWSTYVANLRHACEAARAQDTTVLVEAIGPGTIARYILNDPAVAVSAVTEVGPGNLAIILDVFHETNAGRDPLAFLREHRTLVAHVHVADHPGRHEPGTGTIDFDGVFSVLDEIGYAGAVGLEYVPAADTLSGLRWRDSFASVPDISQPISADTRDHADRETTP